MVVSTRSKDYQDPEGSTNTSVFRYNSVPIAFNTTILYTLNIPREAIEVTITTVPPVAPPCSCRFHNGNRGPGRR